MPDSRSNIGVGNSRQSSAPHLHKSRHAAQLGEVPNEQFLGRVRDTPLSRIGRRRRKINVYGAGCTWNGFRQEPALADAKMQLADFVR